EEARALRRERRAQERDALRAGELDELEVRPVRELDLHEPLALLVLRRHVCAAVGLELDDVRARTRGEHDHLTCALKVAEVVLADLGDDGNGVQPAAAYRRERAWHSIVLST